MVTDIIFDFFGTLVDYSEKWDATDANTSYEYFCVFRSIRHPIPALFGSLIRSEATHWFKYTKGAGSGGSFPHRFSFQFDFIPVMKQSVANGIS